MSIQCPACGKKLKQITNTHVRTSHPEFDDLPSFRKRYNITTTWDSDLKSSFSQSRTGSKRGPYNWTAEAKIAWAKRAEAQRGPSHWNYGQSWSDESKIKIKEGMDRSEKWQERLRFMKTAEYSELASARTEASIDKIYQSKLNNNLVIPSELKQEFEIYCKMVIGITRSYYKRYKYWIDPTDLKSQGWQIDHMVSKQHGFRNNVHPIVIGGAPNLMMLPPTINRNKWFSSSLTQESLNHRWSVFTARGHGNTAKANKYWEAKAIDLIRVGRFSNDICLDLYHLPDHLAAIIPDILSLPFLKS